MADNGGDGVVNVNGQFEAINWYVKSGGYNADFTSSAPSGSTPGPNRPGPIPNIPHHDTAIFSAGSGNDGASLSPIVAFADRDAAINYFSTQKGINFNGTQTSSTGITIGSPAKGQFVAGLSAPTISGDSGGAATVLNADGSSPMIGFLSGVYGSYSSSTVFSYLTEKQYDAAVSAIPKDSEDIKGVIDTIEGRDPSEIVRGSVRKSNLITNGDGDIIATGSGGGLINKETGMNNVIVLPGGSGQSDSGTTVILSPGVTTVVGGGPNDTLAFLTDRLSPTSQAGDSGSITPIQSPDHGSTYWTYNSDSMNLTYRMIDSDLAITYLISAPGSNDGPAWSGVTWIKSLTQKGS